jgi:hypothetical protein
VRVVCWHFIEHYSIIYFPPELILEMEIRLINPPKLLLGFLIAFGIILGVVFHGQCLIGLLYLQQIGFLTQAQDLIVGLLPLGVVLAEKLLLLLQNAILLKELLEGFKCLLLVEMVMHDLVVVVAPGRVRQDRIGVGNGVELALGCGCVRVFSWVQL